MPSIGIDADRIDAGGMDTGGMDTKELLRLLPKVLRARDFHLYLENGKRLTDLWLQGGRAVLGHKPPKVTGELKNAAERGLFSPLPHPMERRFLKALEAFFPGRAFRLYPDETSLRLALAEAGFVVNNALDPAFPHAGFNTSGHGPVDGQSADNSANVFIWRPFLEPPEKPSLETETAPDACAKEGEASILIPVLPWPPGPAVLVLDKSHEASFPPGELIAPVLLAPAARALYDLAAALKANTRNGRQFPKIGRALKDSLWHRRGIYLSAGQETSSDKYEDLFRRFLESGFLIPPSRAEPLILPASMSAGEETKLAQLLG